MNVFLDKLELYGFKSFPEKTIIRFHRGITAVVGPNGCGKSNIVDAILWVLGEQRIKNLRGDNNEDLIFNGSASKKPLGMTEVAASFQTEHDPVYISRRFFRTGEGRYIHNERAVRHKDIQDELFKMNLGGTNYYIFEQGSIEKLLALKPTEQRALIEEAAGIAKYLERKKETAGKLIISQQNLENIGILLADKNDRLKDLRNQVNYVQRYRKAKEEWQRAQKTVIHKKYRCYSDEFDARRAIIEKLLNNETLLNREVMNLETSVMEGEEQRWHVDQYLKESQKKAYEINRKLTALKGDYDQIVQRQNFLRQRAKDIGKTTLRANKELSEIVDQQQDIKRQLDLGKENLKSLDAELDHLNKKYQTLKDERTKILAFEKDIQKMLFLSQSELTRYNNELREIDKNLLRIENDILTRNKIIQTLKDQNTSLDQHDLAEQLTQIDTELEELCNKQEFAEVTYNKARTAQKQADEIYRSLSGSLQALRLHHGKVIELKNKLVKVDEYNDSPSNLNSLQELIDSNPQNRFLLESFYYDLMDAQIIGSHDETTAAKLKKAKIAHPIATINYEPLRKLDGCIGTVHDLFSLRGNQNKNIYPNGLLVSDLDHALHIFCEYAIPLITSDGTTISADGLLLRKREKGVLDVLAEIHRLDEEIVQTEKSLTIAKDNLVATENDMKSRQQTLSHAQEERKKVEKETIRLRSDLESLRKQVDQNRKRIEYTTNEIDMIMENKQELDEARLEILKLVTSAELKHKENLTAKDTFLRDSQNSLTRLSDQERLVLQKRHECQIQRERFESSHIQFRRLQQQSEKIKEQITQNDRDIKNFLIEADEQDVKKKQNSDQEIVYNNEKELLNNAITSNENSLASISDELKKYNHALNDIRKQLESTRENRAHEEVKVSVLKKDLFNLQELAFKEINLELKDVEPDEEFMKMDIDNLSALSQEMDDRLRKMHESDRLNFSAESEFELLMKEHTFLENQKQDVLNSIEDMNKAIDKIDCESRQKFICAFDEISHNFIENFKILFEGGEAELSLLDTENILETGLEIKAQPPGKRLQGLRLLSGGEKTLTSLAFLFALFQYKPSPFCVFDEVDASLDEANIQRFLKFLHTLKSNTQFLIITHNFKTMEEADFIYGVSMNEPGISSVYSMKLTGNETLEKVDN